MKRYCVLTTAAAELYFELLYNVNKQKKTFWSDYIVFKSSGKVLIGSEIEESLDGHWALDIYELKRYLDEL